MTVVNISGNLFRDPNAGSIINVWLETQATSAERAACMRFLSLLASSARKPSAKKNAYPGTLPSQARPPCADTDAMATGSLKIAAVGSTKQGNARPRSSTGPRIDSRAPTLPPRPASAVPSPPCRLEQPSSAASGSKVAAACGVMQSDWVTTNEHFYGFRSMYPELYETAAAATKAIPAPNLTFKSEYSDSLKKSSGPFWKQFLVTTYESTNASVHKPNLEYQVRRDKGFHDWVRNQQLYYGDLLTAAASSKLSVLLETLDAQTKDQVLFGSRCLYAVLKPDRHKSFSHLSHKGVKSMADPYYEALGKEVTKVKTMGCPVKVQPTARAPAPAVKGENVVNAAPQSCAPRLDPSDFTSKVPMKWPVGGGPAISTYTSTIAASGAQAAAECKRKAKPYKPIVITCPFGSCDRITDVSHRTLHTIPSPDPQRTIVPFQEDARNPPETTHRIAFQRSAADVAKSMAFAARQVAESRAAKNLSTIPLGRGGYNIPHDGLTEKRRCFHAWPIDVHQNNAATSRAKMMSNAPTSSVGVTLGGRSL